MPLTLNQAQRRFLTRLAPRVLLLGFFTTFVLLVAGMALYWWQVQRAPEQPIAFPHTVHAGSLQLPCSYCHMYADKSPRAGVPTLDICMSCHRSIATDRPQIIKLTEHYQARRPVAWNRVHELPDFIYFTHKRHVRAGIECFACHGNLAAMTKVRRVRTLQMGWCVTCHKSNGASIDCATCHL
ncbi:c-type cytochrome [Desulfuromonas versatilis]|uniref:C-type cytochrome n=1 Tax=Desulfuromonas versatilis TaxID=2802975 RepID=A0ABM9SDJ0_9BACT|nr:cytochrome c3 family protein [Desulfuromonas versatilis]BCR03288.1 c-type cytochrome [Desulfuromonas versatilis]